MGQGIAMATGLYAAAADCLATADPPTKCAKTRAYSAAFFAGALLPEVEAHPMLQAVGAAESVHFDAAGNLVRPWAGAQVKH